MATTPINPNFLVQKSEQEILERNIANYQVRTGQKFGDIARQRLFERQVLSGEEEARRVSELAFRAREAEKDREVQREAIAAEASEAKKAREAQEQSFFGQIKKAFS